MVVLDWLKAKEIYADTIKKGGEDVSTGGGGKTDLLRFNVEYDNDSSSTLTPPSEDGRISKSMIVITYASRDITSIDTSNAEEGDFLLITPTEDFNIETDESGTIQGNQGTSDSSETYYTRGTVAVVCFNSPDGLRWSILNNLSDSS